ncbi:MAG: patatin-like phospholipase family protein [Chloroflexi bacterium]|nr:MAG: patatin-like phospholipase family protein [Chloroflexota bacterium]
MVGKSDTTRLTRSWLRGALSRPLQACNGASTSFQPAATDPLHSAVAHVRIGISNVIPMRETGFWRSPSMLSTWWRRRRPTLAQPGEKQRRLVFVLGGGGSRGACSVGVLKALLEAGIKPDGLVGCSSGAFNAVALAAKPDLETIAQLAQVWRSIRNRDLFHRNPLRMAYRYVRTRNSVFDSRYLRTLAAMNLPATFEQLSLPCAVIATNLTRARKEIFTTGSVPDAVAASAAIPGLFNPYRIGDEEFVDGAVAENVGLPEAIQLGATHIVAIDNSTSNPRRPPNHTLTGILAQSIQIMLGQRMLEEYQRYSDQAEICLMVPNVEFGTAGTDFSQVDRLIDEAYARTRGFLEAGGLDRKGRLEPGIHYMLPLRHPSVISLAQ